VSAVVTGSKSLFSREKDTKTQNNKHAYAKIESHHFSIENLTINREQQQSAERREIN